MAIYAFELGRLKDLSIAELNAVLGEKNHIETVWEMAIYELDKIPQNLQNSLGGTIKIADVVDLLDPTANKGEILEFLERILTEHFNGQTGKKIPFAISTYNLPGSPQLLLKEFLNFSKKIIKSLGLNCRFVNKPWVNPTPAQVYKSRSVEKGVDLSIIKGKKNIYIAKTISIQDIDSYSIRDFDKPFRDARMGMLPPKLAQIMLNLAQVSRDEKIAPVIFDPFCGSGTILMEAMLQGYDSVGSDIDERAVEGTQKNMDWLKELLQNSSSSNFPMGKTPTCKIFQKDATRLTAEDFPKDLSAIVSETYLGNPISKLPPPEQRKMTFDNLSNLHYQWLSLVAKFAPKNIKLVITIPAFNLGKDFEHFPNFKELVGELGFKIENPNHLLYFRQDQLVAREIVVLTRD